MNSTRRSKCNTVVRSYYEFLLGKEMGTLNGPALCLVSEATRRCDVRAVFLGVDNQIHSLSRF
jgi:hypothetical protein